MKELLDEKIFQKFIENHGTFFWVLLSNIMIVKISQKGDGEG